MPVACEAVMSRVTICGLLSFLLISACSRSSPVSVSFSIAESKSYEASIYRQNCAVCHGAEADGKEIGGRMIPSLRYGDAAQKSQQEIYDQIKFGKLPMPAFGNQLTEDEICRWPGRLQIRPRIVSAPVAVFCTAASHCTLPSGRDAVLQIRSR